MKVPKIGEQKMIAIARIRRAAAALKAKSIEEMTLVGLADEMGCDKAELARYVTGVNGLKEEIGLTCWSIFTGPEYEAAAERLIARNELISTETLAAETGKRVRTVWVFFQRNPDWAEKLGVLSSAEARIALRRRTYESIIASLYSKGSAITAASILRECDFNRWLVYKDFRRNFDLDQLTQEVLASLQKKTPSDTSSPMGVSKSAPPA